MTFENSGGQARLFQHHKYILQGTHQYISLKPLEGAGIARAFFTKMNGTLLLCKLSISASQKQNCVKYNPPNWFYTFMSQFNKFTILKRNEILYWCLQASLGVLLTDDKKFTTCVRPISNEFPAPKRSFDEVI